MSFLPVPFKELFKPIFNLIEIEKISADLQHGIDRMRGFIGEDTYRKDIKLIDVQYIEKTDANRVNQAQRHFVNALNAVCDIVEDHKKISLFKAAWRYLNVWPVFKFLFSNIFRKKTEAMAVEKIINHKAILKTLIPAFQELVLGQVCLDQNASELDNINEWKSLIFKNVKKYLQSLSWNDLVSLKNNPNAFFGKVYLESLKLASREFRMLPGFRKTPEFFLFGEKIEKNIQTLVQENQEKLPGLGEGLKAIRKFLESMTTLETEPQKGFSEIYPVVMSDHLKKSEWQAQICAKVATLHESAQKIVVFQNQKNPNLNNAFREIVTNEYPTKLSFWGDVKAAFGFKAAKLKHQAISDSNKCGEEEIYVRHTEGNVNTLIFSTTKKITMHKINWLRAVNYVIERENSKGKKPENNRLGKILDRVERVAPRV